MRREGVFQEVFGRENHTATEAHDPITNRDYIVGDLLDDTIAADRQLQDFKDKARLGGSSITYRNIPLEENQVFFIQDETGLAPQIHGVTDGTHQNP